MTDLHELKRSLSLPLITFYGLGTIIGAGIYVLVGKVAGTAGMHAPMAFLVASVVAAFTAFSYAGLVARFPRSAGEAIYAQQAFNCRRFSILVGLLISVVGVVSSATLATGFVGYLNEFIALPRSTAIILVVVSLGVLAAWGITQSVTVASLLCLVEIGGLLIVLWVARGSFLELPARWPEMRPVSDPIVWEGILLGGFLAFYAYIGFEDMVNVAEEVRRPSVTLPRAIVLALVISTVLYMAIAAVSVLVVAPAELARSAAPLVDIYRVSTGQPATTIGVIGLVSVLNGLLIQIIMASRILYGMSRQGWLPGLFGRVNPVTRTPLIATVLITLTILALALWLPLVTLAKVTSFVTLSVFAVVNLALWRVRRRELALSGRRTGRLWAGPWLPMAGFVSCLALLSVQFAQMALR